MASYPYLHIALRGEINGNTGTIYSYPSAGSDLDPRWNNATVEPGAAIKRFLNANDCYVLQDSPLGHYFSFITRSALKPQRGFMMISVLVDNRCALTGRSLMNLFANLSRTLIDEEDYRDEAVEDAIARAGIPQEPLILDAWAYQPFSGTQTPAEAAYRTYISQQELESIFSFPYQPEYAEYRCVIVVSAATSLRPGVKMPRLTAPIRKLYSVVCPEGVTASNTQVYDGDRLELTYSRPGFDDHKECTVVGTPSAYTKYEGSTINVRTSEQTGIRFERKTPVSVVSAKGLPVHGYTITLNGRSVNTMEPFIVFYEKDLQPGSMVSLSVRSTNFRTIKLKKTAEEMLLTESLEFVMQPDEKGITLRLDFGDGRVFEQQISIEKNTPEYNRLHSGSFHGFRAHRLVTNDEEDGEIYNVDLRLPARNPAIAGSGEKTEQTSDTDRESSHKVPHFENVSADVRTDSKPKSYGSMPAKASDASKEKNIEEGTNKSEYRTDASVDAIIDGQNEIVSFYRRKGFIITIVALTVIVLVGLWFATGGKSSDSDPVSSDSIVQTSATAPKQENIVTMPMTADEQADTEYLNTNEIWVVEKLHSTMGKSLISAINEGDIDAVVNNDYFAVGGRATNRRATDLADLIWRAKGSYSESGNRKVMRQAVKNGSIDLRKFTDDLAKCRPSEKANDTPRPRR